MARTNPLRTVLVLLIATGLAAAAGLPSVVVAATDPSDAEEAAMIRKAVARGEVAPLPRILAIAKRRVPGEVIKVELEQEDGLLIYEIKILSGNGRVREVKLDAHKAKLLSVEDD